jgi:EmrB/QacA subfamily drug resistance transporter
MTPSSRQPVLIALLVAGAFFMENLDATVIVTALPDMAASFGVRAIDLNVGLSAYLLTLAVFIPASGWVADRFGARSVFTTAIAVFTLASALCAASDSLWSFTAARVLQGVGGAMMVPVGRLVVLRNTAKQDLMRSIAYITWPALAAPVLGPPVGGLITSIASWRWIFLLNLPLGAIALVLALRLIPNDRSDARTPFDWLGFVLTGIACLALMLGLDLIGHQEIPWLSVGALLATALLLGAWAVRHARHHPHPLVGLAAMAIHTYRVTVRGGSLFRAVVSAVPFLLPLMFQLGFGLDPVHSGLLVLALFAGNLGMKPMTSWVLRSFGFRTALLANGTLLAATLFGCALLTPDTPTALVAALLVVSGAARSMQFTSLNTLAFVDVPAAGMSAANTLFSVTQQISMGLGVALGAIALRLAEASGLAGGSVTRQYQIAFAVIAVLAVLSLIDALALRADAGREVSGHRKPQT